MKWERFFNLIGHVSIWVQWIYAPTMWRAQSSSVPPAGLSCLDTVSHRHQRAVTIASLKENEAPSFWRFPVLGSYPLTKAPKSETRWKSRDDSTHTWIASRRSRNCCYQNQTKCFRTLGTLQIGLSHVTQSGYYDPWDQSTPRKLKLFFNSYKE